MNKLASIFVLLAFGMALSIPMIASSGKRKSKNSVDLSNVILIQIEPTGPHFDKPDVFHRGGRIMIRCLIRNIGKKSVKFSLKDHDAYFGTLPYPIEAYVRVVRDDGRVVTASELDSSGKGWWTKYSQYGSTFRPIMPGDVIAIPPAGVVARSFPIHEMIAMAPGAKGGLGEGVYSIQLCINELLSNVLVISVVPPE